MQWMFGAMQIFMAKETVAKMKWMSYGTELHKDLGSSVPKAYGGKGADLATAGRSLKHGDVSKAATTQAAETKPIETEAAEKKLSDQPSQPQQPASSEVPPAAATA